MKRLVGEAFGVYALCVAAEALALRAAGSLSSASVGGAGFWSGVLTLNVFVAAMLAGALHLRRLASAEGAETAAAEAAAQGATPDSGFWWRAALWLAGGLTLAALAAPNSFYGVAALIPPEAMAPLAVGVFGLSTICARTSFWAVSQGLESFRLSEELEA